MEIIQAEHVTRLLHAEEENRVLIIHKGRADVVPESALDDPGYEGALRLVSRTDLGPEHGSDSLSQEGAEAMARRLNAAVESLGG